jgi:hypothetical protein
MTLIVKAVPANYVAQAWPLVEKYLADAVAWGGEDYTLEQVQVYLSQGSWSLLAAVDEQGVVHGAATVTFLNYPNDRIAFITFIGGKLISNKNTFGQLKDLLKANGATKIQGAAREAIARLWSRYGFEERYRIVETKI